jgi:hypothetical protein
LALLAGCNQEYTGDRSSIGKAGILTLPAVHGDAPAKPGTIKAIFSDYETARKRRRKNLADKPRKSSFRSNREGASLELGERGSDYAFIEGSSAAGTMSIRIKGSRSYIDAVLDSIERVTGTRPKLKEAELVSETTEFMVYPKKSLDALDAELSKTMRAHKASPTSWFNNGLQGVYHLHDSAQGKVRFTIDGDQAFVDSIKKLIQRTR